MTLPCRMLRTGPQALALGAVLVWCLSLVPGVTLAAQGPLASWKDGATREAIIAFVETVTDPASSRFVAPDARIATFDNDGTLWAEQPAYFQALFVFDRIRALAPQHPEWKTLEPYASVLRGDTQAALAGGEAALLEMVMATHAGMSTEEFAGTVKAWLATARHPGTGRPYTQMVYQPMLELLDYLRAAGFKTFIVSGGGIEFMRPWVQAVYGIPPEQVVGSSIKTRYAVVEGVPTLLRLPEMNFIDDKAGKPVGINAHIGRRPVIAVGNSDGDFEMLEWSTAGEGARLGVLIHHTDSAREWAYDRDSHIGRLARGLDEAAARGWLVVDMKRDWTLIFPPQ
ncbi:MAG: HAD family hydrolase [Halioglobus sp.]